MKQQHNTRYRAWTWALILVTGLGLGLVRGTRRMQAAPPPPPPNTLVVTNTTDNDPGSLRQAITNAAAGDTITFAANVTGEIALSSGQLEINKNLTIQGPGAQVLTLRNTKEASTTSRVLVVLSGTANISGLTFTGGRPNGIGFGCGGPTCGGGINNAGSLTLTHCVVTGNSISGDSLGGGIYTRGLLTLVNSTVANNSLSSGGSFNHGGGIYNAGGTVNLLNSTVSGNTVSGSDNQGGGIYTGGGGTLGLTNSTISGNRVSGGDFSQGGGIYNSGSTITATNCTITDNSARDVGKASQGGGVNGNLTARNTLIAGNTVSGGVITQGPDVAGTLTSQGNNLLGIKDGIYTTITNQQASDQIGTPTNPINPKLDLLGNYGGPTQTHRPQFDSPAVNAGSNAGAPATDQRGYGRPYNGGTVDIGAVERGAPDAFPVTETNGEITLTRDPATDGGQELIAAIEVANDNPAPTTIRLVCGTYSYATAHNWEFGPNALPIIRSPITIVGAGAVLNSTNATRLRFFYVAGNGVGGLTPGTLTLQNLTLQNGKQKGGDSGGGGGGAGMGGAIFNHGNVTLERVTLTGNTATGGSSGLLSTNNFGGGGMGQDAVGSNGGGFGGTPTGSGGAGGAGTNGGGGGGGFLLGANGMNANGNNGGNGGGSGLLGGNGSSSNTGAGGTRGDGGGGVAFTGSVAAGGDYGVGAGSGGGGGIGGGGGSGGGGGFGGGGGSFGGGGFGIGLGGGGGWGLGGALFNHQGTLTLINCTLTQNTARGGNGGSVSEGSGGNGGSGFGGALFNLNGSVTFTSSTLAANTVLTGERGTGNFGNGTPGEANGGAVYNLAYGNDFTNGGTTTAQVTLRNSILANSTGGSDLVNDQRDLTTTPDGSQGAGDNTATVDYGERNIVMSTAALSNISFTGSLYSSADPNFGALQITNCQPAVLPLQSGSPAINAATTDANVTTDQLGTSRSISGAPDLGAVEFIPSNTAPMISAIGISRVAGNPGSSSSIATVNDAEDAENTLSVTASPLMGSGVTVNSISVSSNGNVTANVAASCGATTSTFTLRVTDSGTLFNEATLTVTVNPETTPPTINPINNVVVSLPLNSSATSMVVNFPLPTATDNCTTNPILTTNPASGSVFPVGTTTINVTARDDAMNQTTSSFTVTVRYNFSGFFSPVDNLPIVNRVNAGQSIPVKFSLSGNKGLNIFAAGFPQSAQIACSGGAADDIEETVTAGASSLSYDATTDRYNYVWKTDKAWKGTCRKLILRFNDGTTREALFQFK